MMAAASGSIIHSWESPFDTKHLSLRALVPEHTIEIPLAQNTDVVVKLSPFSMWISRSYICAIARKVLRNSYCTLPFFHSSIQLGVASGPHSLGATES
jgi:hypothetical protein